MAKEKGRIQETHLILLILDLEVALNLRLLTILSLVVMQDLAKIATEVTTT
jgi:hypothetical protein